MVFWLIMHEVLVDTAFVWHGIFRMQYMMLCGSSQFKLSNIDQRCDHYGGNLQIICIYSGVKMGCSCVTFLLQLNTTMMKP